MIFLIHYDRRAGAIKTLQTFGDKDRLDAESARMSLESSVNELTDDEIVLLEAQSVEELHKTHRRYFATASDLLKTAADEASTASSKN